MTKYNILIIDDDTRLRNLLGKFLEENNFQVSLVNGASAARDALKSDKFDLMIVDVMMPQEDGISFTKDVRQYSKVPIIILTARGDFNDRIKGLESGADDYLAKPFEPKELLLRINNILKRITINDKQENCVFGDYIFDLKNLKLSKNDEFIYLTETEIKILNILCENQGEAIDREKISGLLGGVDSRTIDVQITRLRRKIEQNPKKPQFLQTIRNKGYKIC
jgi:two-component system phosphate regulon response regulator OmpR